VLDPKLAPFPEILPGPLDHSNDLIYAPLFAVLGAKIPAEARKNFEGFVEERQIRRVITPQRVATAWIGRDFIAGAESTNLTREAGAQFHPATVHWKTPNGEVAWIRLYQGPRLNAQVEKETLTISGVGDFTFRMNGPALESRMVQRELWLLPGLSVKLDTDARAMTVTPGNGFMDVQYREATKFTLHLTGNLK
jgi:hypothetical protein